MQKPDAADQPVPGTAPRAAPIHVVVKSVHRTAPTLDVTLTSGGGGDGDAGEYEWSLATTSLLDVRSALAARTGVSAAKLRLLYNKRPAADSKALKDFVGDGDKGKSSSSPDAPVTIELGVMVVGGAATVAAAHEAAAAAAAAATGTKAAAAAPSQRAGAAAPAAESEGFWTDLRAFLVQRTGDTKQADELFSLFLRAWEDRME